MRRKVIGYDKTIELMKKGYALRKSPVDSKLYMYVGDEIISIRYDVLLKLFMNKVSLKNAMDGYVKLYYLVEEMN